jgi:voltage-gated potassium channel Kch
MKKATTGQKLRYAFDNTMSKGTGALMIWLGIVTIIVITIAAAIVVFFNMSDEAQTFPEGFWHSMMRAFDAGNVAGDIGWPMRILMFGVTLSGIFILSTLIGILSSGIESKLDELRKGRSFVVEKDHTLILGWSTKVFTIISELVIANENQKKPRIVILADKDKVEMEDEIRTHIPKTKNTRIICRNGNPADLNNLVIANPHQAKSIIVLNKENENADSLVIKIILALTNSPDRKKEPYHILAEIKDEKNAKVAKLIGKDEVTTLLVDDIISRIMVQTSRQSGLSMVYQELMDFDGDEIYMQREKSLTGKTFGELLSVYPTSSVIGIRHGNGVVKVNPPMDTVLANDDDIVAITEDDDTLVPSAPKAKTQEDLFVRDYQHQGPVKEDTLMLGWNKRASIIIRELDNYVAPESTVLCISHLADPTEELNELQKKLKNMSLRFIHEDVTDLETLTSLEIGHYENVILLSHEEYLDGQEADAQTLITLFHLRSLSENLEKKPRIVSQMLDVKNRELAAVTKVDDFIVSDKLISLMLSQISENKSLEQVFEDILDADGSEIYLKPMSDYVQTGKPVNFYTVVEVARLRGEVAFGYKLARFSDDPDKAYGVKVNPAKAENITYEPNDKIIVLAEE